MNTDTIAAVATPIGRGGIGIIKISGQDALAIAESIFQKSGVLPGASQAAGTLSFSTLKSHRLYHGHVVDADKKRVLDEVLLAVMRSPRTYTREHVVEINTHSGPMVLSAILELVLRKGARLAEPGEFTKRAYLGGRIDLTQAEAVIDVINSKTDKALQIATAQISGELKRNVESIRNVLLDILTEIEAAIDFPDDVEDIIDDQKDVTVIEDRVIAPLQQLIARYENGHVFRDGLKMAVIGKPNVGKSSLLNQLIENDRAIVTPIPGTTRDLIEETLNIRGIPVIIADTAGLHETEDPVEVIGIRKTREYIRDADLVLFMVDASELLTIEDHNIFEAFHARRLIVVANKIDLLKNDVKIELPESWGQVPNIGISALYGTGLSELKRLIAQVSIGDYQMEAGNTIIPNLRHKTALERCLSLVLVLAEAIRNRTTFELIAIDIRDVLDTLGEIDGITTREDVIDQIFSRFCIGK